MEDTKEIIYKARYAVKQNWLKARQILEAGHKEYPSSEELAIELAQLYFNKRLYKKSITICQRTLLDNPNDQLYFLAASCFLNLREYEIALDYFNRIENETPEQLYNKAVALARCDKYKEAIALTEKVIGFNVKSHIPHLFLSELYYITKEYDKAIRVCDQTEKIFGISGELLFMRGMCYRSTKNILKAYWDFHKAEMFNLRNTEYHRNYGLVAESLGKLTDAICHFQAAIDLSPTSIASYMELFRLYLSNNMLNEASFLLALAKESLPDSFPLSAMYNRVIDKLQDSNENK